VTQSAQEIIVHGKPVRCLAPVRHWTATGMHFLTRMRIGELRWIVNHWTGAENRAEAVFDNMCERRVSVHFIVDQLGTIWQTADTAARCAHAADNGGNSWGIGIEVINRGHGSAPMKGFVRPRRTEVIHGHKVTYGDFFEPQIASVIALNAALCTAYGLPMRVPQRPDGTVWPTTLPAASLATFRGCLGHLHLDAVKPDPGLELLRRIHVAGLEVA
jgi:hypothetical protein